MKKNSKIKIGIVTELTICIIIGIYCLLLWQVPEKVIQKVDVLIRFTVWFLTLTIPAMLPGLIYEGGKGYSKILQSNLISTKEKGYLFFLLEIVVGFFLVLLFGLLLDWFLPTIKKYLVLIFIEWLLLLYIVFSKARKYKFPWAYFLFTNIIVIFWWFIIYKFL